MGWKKGGVEGRERGWKKGRYGVEEGGCRRESKGLEEGKIWGGKREDMGWKKGV